MTYKTSLPFYFLLGAMITLSSPGSSQDNNWTHFRGSNLNGIAVTENVPVNLDSTIMKWKTKIHDEGYSSPVVYDNQIWVTSAKSDGKELYAICIDFKTGKIIYDIKVFSPDKVEGKHSINTCLLYTSDAADEEDSVDLGGRRIIKKKKKKKIT